MTLKISPTPRILTRSFIRPTQARIWKLIWRRKLQTIKNAEYWRIIPDIINFAPKSTLAIAGPKYEHKHTCDDSKNSEVFIKESFNSSNLSFISFSMEFRDDWKKESNNRCDDNKRNSDYTQIIGIIPCIFGSEEIYDELHIDLSKYGSDIGSKYDPKCILDNFPNQFAVDDNFRIF